jgi:lipopolysaccharide/colanic/teichoic acid biosynthesis glycosyltransferase
MKGGNSNAMRNGSRRVEKRAVDVFGATALLILSSPIMVVVALLVRLTSPGPALFKQVRVGRDSEPFVMFKFRTMYHGSDDALHRAYVTQLLSLAGPTKASHEGIFKIVNDPRVTRIGTILRRTSLDELPQLFNVLRGDMSLVGPRPALTWEVALYRPEDHARFMVHPGMTGLWQVGGRNEITMRDALRMDVEYARHRTMRLDVAILLKTLPVALKGRGAA